MTTRCLPALALLMLVPGCGTVARTTAKAGTKTVGLAAKATAKTAWGAAKTGGKLATSPLRRRDAGGGSGAGGGGYAVGGRRYQVMTQVQARRYRETGAASYYASGRQTANGERFSRRASTAAHKTLPFGTRVRVTNLDNGRSTVVRINDRGPFVRGRIIDLTPAGADRLGFRRQGVARVRVETVR
jgi:rare lipoprotein A